MTTTDAGPVSDLGDARADDVEALSDRAPQAARRLDEVRVVLRPQR